MPNSQETCPLGLDSARILTAFVPVHEGPWPPPKSLSGTCGYSEPSNRCVRRRSVRGASWLRTRSARLTPLQPLNSEASGPRPLTDTTVQPLNELVHRIARPDCCITPDDRHSRQQIFHAVIQFGDQEALTLVGLFFVGVMSTVSPFKPTHRADKSNSGLSKKSSSQISRPSGHRKQRNVFLYEGLSGLTAWIRVLKSACNIPFSETHHREWLVRIEYRESVQRCRCDFEPLVRASNSKAITPPAVDASWSHASPSNKAASVVAHFREKRSKMRTTRSPGALA